MWKIFSDLSLFNKNVEDMNLHDDGNGSGAKTLEPKDIRDRPLPIVSKNNIEALKNREWIKHDYLIRHIRPRDKRLNELHRAYSYSGSVRVDVSGHPGVDMLFFSDDTVARVYFYFGKDSFESTSVYLWSQLARTAGTVLDIGSYTGLYGILAARLSSDTTVYCFEPVPHIAQRVADNRAINDLSNIHVVNAAISETSGIMPLFQYGNTTNSPGSSLRKKKSKQEVGTINVDVHSLDDLKDAGILQGRVDLIKIDTEGDEYRAIRGGYSTISKDRPTIFAEVLAPNKFLELESLAKELSYSLYFVEEDERQLVKSDGLQAVESLLRKKAFGNVILSPSEEKNQTITRLASAFCGMERRV